MTLGTYRARLRTWYVAFPALLIIALLLTACGGKKSDDTSGMDHGGTGSSATTTASAPFDQQFIDMMVPHHMGAVEMAKIAQNRGEHPEIKKLASDIIAAQDSEITQMKQWRKTWYGSDQTPSMDHMATLPGMDPSMMSNMMNMGTDIKNLQTASPFDKAFLNAMIPHHQSAIAAGKIAKDKGDHPEIKTLAGNIITSQQKELDQMQQWLKAWYGRTP